jgi:AraC family transcriptional activator of pobA
MQDKSCTMREKPLPRSPVPNFALYGAAAGEALVDIVHHESIPVRASRFDFAIQPHFHDALIQILYATKGAGEAFIDGQVYQVEPPWLIVVPARSVHGYHFREDVDGHVVTALQCAVEAVAQTVSPDLLNVLRTPVALTVAPASRRATLDPLFDAIGREAERHEHWQFCAGLSLIVALFVQIARLSEGARLSTNPARSRLVARIERLRKLLDEGCHARRPVASYAEAMGVTSGQLTRLCREAFGVSAIGAIDARAVHEAKRLLGYSTLSVKQIANELGFQDEAYFGRFFRKQTGLRATEYRTRAGARMPAP